MKWLLLVLCVPAVFGLRIDGATLNEPLLITEPTFVTRSTLLASPAFIITDNSLLRVSDNSFYGREFLEMRCQEDVDVGLHNCSDVVLDLVAVRNNFFGTSWTLYSDETPTGSITLHNNYYSAYNLVDLWFVFEHNHDLIDYHPARTPFLRPQGLKTPIFLVSV